MRNWIFGRKTESQETNKSAVQASQLIEESKEGPADTHEEDDEELDEFFDCVNETEVTDVEEMKEEEKKSGEQSANRLGESAKAGAESGGRTTRDKTSFQLFFNIKELSLTLGKLSTQNKIEGIQIYNKAVSVVTKAPSLNIDKQFETQTKIMEWGLNLITLNRRTNMIDECVSVIQTNKNMRSSEQVPQWDMTLKKNDPATALSDVEYEINLLIG